MRWKQHTWGGKCIHCGDSSGMPGHLAVCKKIPVESIPREIHEKQQNAVGHGLNETAVHQGTKRPFPSDSPAVCSNDSNNRNQCTPNVASRLLPSATPVADAAPVVPAVTTNEPTAPIANTRAPVQISTTKNLPKKPKLSAHQTFFLHCPACDQKGCPYSYGLLTVFKEYDGQETEYDPCEPSCDNWLNGLPKLSFHDAINPLNTIVAASLCSKGLWSINKCIGSGALDKKLDVWMKLKLDDPGLVKDHWALLRRGVKEALRYRRLRSVEAVRVAFFGMFVLPPEIYYLLAVIASLNYPLLFF